MPIRFATAMVAALLAFQASAQTSPMLSHGDKSFLEKAAKAGMEEVDISRAVVERTTNPEVKAFAQTMIDDHGAANSAVASLAGSKGVELPAKDMDDVTKWTKKSASSLDADYISKMVSDHEDAVKLFQKESEKGTDMDTKGFARDTLPKLQHHLEMAMDLKKTVK